MQAVILAAGDGGRLRTNDTDLPKPLVLLHSRPLVSYVLDALSAAGIDDAAIVVGYRGDEVCRALDGVAPCGMRLRFVQNEAYDLASNARSLWAAREAVTGGFLLAMADHLIEPAIARAVLSGASARCRLAVDRAGPTDPRTDGATRARVEGSAVVELGKDLSDWNALDTGVFWCTREVFAAITPDRRDGEAGAVFAELARTRRLDAVDVTGMRWIDIDTPNDLQQAEAALTADGRLA